MTKLWESKPVIGVSVFLLTFLSIGIRLGLLRFNLCLTDFLLSFSIVNLLKNILEITKFLSAQGVWGLGFGVWGLGFGVWEIGRAHV